MLVRLLANLEMLWEKEAEATDGQKDATRRRPDLPFSSRAFTRQEVAW